MQGKLAGGLWGLVLGSVGLVITSVATDPPSISASSATPQMIAPETAQTDVVDRLAGTSTASGRNFDANPQRVAAPAENVSAPAPDTEPSPLPDTSDVDAAMGSPTIVPLPEVTTAVETPVLPSSPTAAPVIPAPEQELVVATVPTATNLIEELTEPDSPTVREVPTQTAPAEQAIATPEPDAPRTEGLIVSPAPEQEQPNQVRVNRFNDPNTASEPEVQTEVTDEMAEDTPALVRYAAPFEKPDGLSLMSVILIDNGNMPNAVSAVSALSFPVTVILNPLEAEAETAMQEYRAVGIEIGMQSALPPGVTHVDVEVAFEAAFTILRDSVILLDMGDGSLRKSRSAVDQVIAVLAAGGRGLVATERGLNNPLRTAQNAGLPALSVYRDVDGAGQNPAGMRRGLDQAALRARQESGVVVVARVSPETLDVLRAWGPTIDGQIALAPVSALMTAQ